jgi:hypothetical protein
MSKYDVKYNTGSAPSGTTKSNNLAISTGSPDYTQPGWFAGIDDTIYSGGSAQFNGSNSLSGSTSLSAIGDFTVECWIYPTTTSECDFLKIGNEATGRIVFYTYNRSILYNIYGDSSVILTGANSITQNAWQHIAVVRSGTTITAYINGVVGVTPASGVNGTLGNSSGWSIMSGGTGYITNLRYNNTTAVYTGSFVAPVNPLSATQGSGTNISAISSGTKLLLLASSSGSLLSDSSGNNLAVTNNGGVSYNALTPFSASTSCYLFISNSTDLSLTGRSIGGGSGTIQAGQPVWWRTNDKTDAEVLRVINRLPQRPQNFADATSALAWVRGSSYYTVYPSIVTAGLNIHLDAGNTSSYPGSGTTWTSLTGSYSGTLGAGVSYSSSNGGVLNFNGGASASVNMYGTASALASITNNISVEAWYKSNNNYPAILRTGVSSSGFVFGYYSGTGTSWKVTKYGVIDLNAGAIPQDTAWHQVVLTYSSTTGARVYVDGALSSPTSANTSNISAGNEFSIGKSEAVQFNGSMGIFRWYSSVLSAADVTQNFNATRSRFGI